MVSDKTLAEWEQRNAGDDPVLVGADDFRQIIAKARLCLKFEDALMKTQEEYVWMRERAKGYQAALEKICAYKPIEHEYDDPRKHYMEDFFNSVLRIAREVLSSDPTKGG